MALVEVREEGRRLVDPPAVAAYLASQGIDSQRWEPSHPVDEGAPPEAILEAYAGEIEKLKAEGGYTAVDVIDVNPETPGLEAMLAKFRREHWHDEDEVRFIIQGSGIFFVRPQEGPVFAIEVGPGDLIRVPRGTWHWFDLCADRRIRAIRLFQDPAGWTPRYTDSGVEQGYQPICFGPTLPRGEAAAGRR